MMRNLQTLLLDLFHDLRSPRSAGMKLTLEQFDLLCQAVANSDGITNSDGTYDWDQLRRLCRLVWVKPHENYDGDRLEKAFDSYVEKCQPTIDKPYLDKPRPLPEPPERELGVLPQIPPRVFHEKGQLAGAVKPSPKKSIIGVKTFDSQFVLQQLPLNLNDLKQMGRSLRRPYVSSRELEIDLDATVDKISREGFLNDVVQRPVVQRQVELLLLIDDDNPMIPFRPVLQPLIQEAMEHRFGLPRIYRFTTYPVQYLYPWKQPTQAVAVSTVLTRLHPQRTFVIIVSDSGAANGTYNPLRVKRTGEFFAKLLPCVRDILWLNPVPSHRWPNTTAASLALALAGRMVPLDRLRVRQQVAKGRNLELGVKLWSLMN
jgi:uncharacterized protein